MNEFADRLNALFAAFLQPASGHGRRREEWTNSEVARLATDQGGAAGEKPVLTRQYLGLLRSGERTQPSLRAANAIAVAFAELSRRAGTPCEPAAILSYLAGEHPQAGDRPADAEQVLEVLVGDHGEPVSIPVSARLSDESDPDSLRDIEALIDRLSRQDAEGMRQRLARLLRLRQSGTDPSG